MSVTRSSGSIDPDPLVTGDGGITFPGLYVEGAYGFPANLQGRLLAEWNREATLQTIFTQDEGADRRATSEVRLRPELRFYFSKAGYFKPFVGGGVEYTRQFFQPVGEGHSYGRRPNENLNPLFTAGTGIGYNHEASFTRLFNGTLNSSYLNGYRVGYSYTRPITERLALKIGGEADYVSFRECSGFDYKSCDGYYEKDTVLKARVGFIFK